MSLTEIRLKWILAVIMPGLFMFAIRFVGSGCTISRYYGIQFPLVEGLDEQVKLKEAMDGVYAYEYYPNAQGKYTASITWGGQHIPKR